MSSKKPEKKNQEPTADQMEESGKDGGAVPAAPLAAPVPSLEDRVAALEKAVLELEARVKKHEIYHFGRPPE